MASFRILNQAPQYFTEDGEVNSGGKLYFYETDLTTPKTTWTSPGMFIENPNPVVMDSAGRTESDVWGDGEYGVVMTLDDDTVVWTRNNVQASGDPGTDIPALVTNAFLTNDGSVLQWQDIRQVPDPTGESGKQLGTDGELLFWEAKPIIPDLPADGIADTSTSFRIGDFLYQCGTGTIAANGSEQSSGSITFPEAFDGVPVNITLQMKGSMMLSHTITTATETEFGYTAGGNIPGITIDTPQPFYWEAKGPAVIEEP